MGNQYQWLDAESLVREAVKGKKGAIEVAAKRLEVTFTPVPTTASPSGKTIVDGPALLKLLIDLQNQPSDQEGPTELEEL